MTGFSQKTVGMKFVPHPPPYASGPLYYATYYIWDVTNQNIVLGSQSPNLNVLSTQENTYIFPASVILIDENTYRFVAIVTENSGYGYTDFGASDTFTGIEYNRPMNFKKTVDVIYL